MIELYRFDEGDFERFKSWIKNQDELFQFAGPMFAFPLSDQQLNTYANDSRRIPYKIQLIDNEVIGHCELNFENPLPRLSRILIADKNIRGNGLGQLVVNKMLEKLFNNIQLSHYQENTPNILDALKKTQEDIQNLQAQKDKFFSIIVGSTSFSSD